MITKGFLQKVRENTRSDKERIKTVLIINLRCIELISAEVDKGDKNEK